jgi:hypothetical protein
MLPGFSYIQRSGAAPNIKTFMFKPFAILCMCSVLHAKICAQTADPLFKNEGDRFFDSVLREQEPVHRGAEYWWFPHKILNGIVYFHSDTITKGRLQYYNRSYNNVPLIYDQSTDELITVDLAGKVMIRLFSPEVGSFKIHGSEFIRLQDSSNPLRQGFWQVLVQSEPMVLKRELKTIRTRVIDHKLARLIEAQRFYRVFYKGKYHEVQDRKAMIGVFADHKKELQIFLRKNRRRFRKAGYETMLVRTAEYYSQLSSNR